ncbi:MAG: hypothetical protein AUH79_07285 [Betaproteobacteria bacterium 13_1_40CM_4_64_4]|nr:MAG: hypothetical protein AUH79_07285 [Betaproteobacteria bacterium 13_1_40CM_4_64_4]
MDRLVDEDRRVVDDLVLHALGEARLQPFHLGADALRGRERVGPRQLEDGHRHRFLAVEVAADVVILRAELDAAHVREARDLPVLARLHHDVGELDGVLEVDAGGRRRLANASSRDLHVLLLQRLQDVCGGHAARGQRRRVEPDAHAVVARAEEADITHPRQPGERVLHLDGGVVAEVELVVALARREQVHAQEDHRRLLLHRDALALHLVRQLRLGDRDPVLGEHLREVEVRPDAEGDVEVHLPVVRALREHVEHVLDAVDLLLDRSGDRVGNDLRARARIGRRDVHRRRDDLRVLRDRQLLEGHEADDHDDDR